MKQVLHQVNSCSFWLQLTALLGCLGLAACAGQPRQEVVDGVTITYLEPRPSRTGASAATSPTRGARTATEPAVSQPPQPGEVYLVQEGDNLSTIARRYGLDYRELARINNLSGNFVIYPGQELQLTGEPRQNVPSPVESPSPAPLALVDDEPELASAGWLWPLIGTPQYLAAPGRDGVYVAAFAGSGIRAINNGRVIYVGDELEQYGKLILISHADDYLSMYGELGEILVEGEQQIRQGQVIGRIGANSGRFYFELRQRGDSINPAQVILSPTSTR